MQELQCCDPAKIREVVDRLAIEIGPRPRTRPDLLNQIRDDIAAYFRRFGYQVRTQPVEWGKTTYWNVIAMPAHEAVTPGDTPLLVVGAHYDTVSHSPGADDNASGIAGLLELARILAPDPPPGIRLVAFCLEEPPVFRTRKMGSYIFAHSLKQQGARVRGMICLEMIGYFQEATGSQSYPFPFMNRIYPKAGNFIALVGNLRSWRWTTRVQAGFQLGTELPIARLNGPSFVYGIDFSDHWSFNRHGYPAVMLTDTAFYRNPHYHKPTDKPGTLDYERAAAVVDGLAAAVLSLSGLLLESGALLSAKAGKPANCKGGH